jgi:hypothetical protein
MKGQVGVAKMSNKRKNPDDYYVPLLSSFVQLGPETEWNIVASKPCIHGIFEIIRNSFFKDVQGIASFTAYWSSDFEDCTTFQIIDKSIFLNESSPK